MFKQACTKVTASGGISKTPIDTLTVPDGCTKIIGVASTVTGGASLTIAEAVSGMIELESDDIGIVPAQFLTDVVNILTTGAVAYTPTQWPCAIAVKGGNKIKVFHTMDMAQTSAFTTRVQLTYN